MIMGAQDFYTTAKGKTARDAFTKAVAQAQYNYGHAGYTGTIAEKSEFVMLPLPADKDAVDYAYEIIGKDDPRVCDKWGPAGCFSLGNNEYAFFGLASS
jgi:hypothetical protein